MPVPFPDAGTVSQVRGYHLSCTIEAVTVAIKSSFQLRKVPMVSLKLMMIAGFQHKTD